MNLRQFTEKREELLLAPAAARSAQSRGRQRQEEPCEIRTDFQRDRDRIVHSKAFRRLKHKTQVFLSPEGDHYRTRLTHTLEVSQIARTIARALRLNEDLTEAISLGHDLGHTPFGHMGEKVLDRICPLGFKHNEQSLRVVDILERPGGLNLTFEVRDGILHHTGAVRPVTLEGKIVALADKVAYINHDIDDAIRGGILTETDIPSKYAEVLGHKHSQRINTMIRAVIEASMDQEDIQMTEPVYEAMMGLRQYMFEHVYVASEPQKEEKKAEGIIEGLYRMYSCHPERIPESSKSLRSSEDVHVLTRDYIAGMSDRYAVAKFTELYIPTFWQR
ncbi:deoxyguanosinetriphosphate triphosphohydrolase [Ructibacterium gallinarum]|uniref:Deoxyguanosinetriphosphate triphosphohydrolase-like protein n=1 Tax=Ructibacterium gallinarum TaxID=2779355 RepID=A0A9D5M0N7_9FIRM|nr:deoxyguanosinetriphosphate triphosphohydrolase [Ructibacterium gallinarum]MBE5039981.1 deoxyguanosinetriphosphate triphosphohydrolase [Ructibacterium gallinarum]